ncbi:MAG TPA: CDP-archaeol synthase [Steroidobacteraceae bacterium]|nr:CDP-archaeol synthase [Steroidobacteraceae bacterium]
MDAARALLLLVLANSLPWIAARVLGGRWGAPLDLGVTLRDGRRLLGSHKTWRGVAAAVGGCALAAAITGLPGWTGAAFALLSLLGDACSSLCKRRLGVAPGLDVPLLDQLPEALLPLLGLRASLALDSTSIAMVAAAFTLLDMLASGIRRRGGARAWRDSRR